MKTLLETRNLKAGYYGRAVVNRINIHVNEGEVVCLLGPNGAGKTTTLLTIAGELDAVDGLVMLNNVPTWEPSYLRVQRRGLGIVTERRLIFTKMSTRDNLRLGNASVDLAIELFPELIPLLDVRCGLLSGGEQQMVALARAFVTEPDILFADEPTGSLDEQNGQKIIQLLFQLNQELGSTLILVTHDMALASRCERQMVLNNGRVVVAV